MSSGRVVRWRLIIEEYGANYSNILGLNNVVIEALSRLPMIDEIPDKNIV